MSKLNRLREELLKNRKAKNLASVTTISTLIGEVERNSKSPAFVKMNEDQIVVFVLKKTVEGLEERRTEGLKIENAAHAYPILKAVEDEMLILGPLVAELIPQQLSQSQLAFIIDEHVAFNKHNGLKGGAIIGAVNKHLQATYPDAYDSKLANELIRTAALA